MPANYASLSRSQSSVITLALVSRSAGISILRVFKTPQQCFEESAYLQKTPSEALLLRYADRIRMRQTIGKIELGTTASIIFFPNAFVNNILYVYFFAILHGTWAARLRRDASSSCTGIDRTCGRSNAPMRRFRAKPQRQDHDQ
jgi:hypothetical protein